MKEQIEEMRDDISKAEKECRNQCKDQKCIECHLFFAGVDCYNQYIAEALYNAGYRKQKEGEWINPDIWLKTMYCSICGAIAPVDCEKEEFYKSNFCPNCGSKMKGDLI